MDFTIVPAPNGFGHIVRMLELARILSSPGKQVQLILPSYAKKIIKDVDINPFISIDYVDWESRKLTTYQNALIFSEKACSIAKHNYLISDNLIEVLFFSTRVLLSANFFWSDQVDFLSKNELYEPISLINSLGVKVVCNKFF
jgi:hypothetical protein